jgi:hypothetical protein
MIEIKFSGTSVDEIRNQIQAFAVMHLNAKFGGMEIKAGVVQAVEATPAPETVTTKYALNATTAAYTENPVKEAVKDAGARAAKGATKGKRIRRTKAQILADKQAAELMAAKHRAALAEQEAAVMAAKKVPKNVTPPQTNANALQRAEGGTPAAMTPEAPENRAKSDSPAIAGVSDATAPTQNAKFTADVSKTTESPLKIVEPAPKDPPKPPPASATVEDVTNALTAVWNKHGMEKSLEVLSRFGVKRARELLPEQHAAFVGYCQEVL